MISTHTATITNPQLPPEATQVHLFKELSGTALVPLGPLVDNECTVTFLTNTQAIVTKKQSGQHNAIPQMDYGKSLYTLHTQPTPLHCPAKCPIS